MTVEELKELSMKEIVEKFNRWAVIEWSGMSAEQTGDQSCLDYIYNAKTFCDHHKLDNKNDGVQLLLNNARIYDDDIYFQAADGEIYLMPDSKDGLIAELNNEYRAFKEWLELN